MRIDMHMHTGRVHAMSANADDLLRVADELGMEKIVTSDLSALYYDFREGNRVTAEAVRQYPDRIVGYVALSSPRFPTIALDEIRRGYEIYGLRGLKIYSHSPVIGLPGQLTSAAEPWMIESIVLAAELGMPVLGHLTPSEAELLARAVPSATIILAHTGATAVANGDWHRGIQAAEACPNIILDLCSSTIDWGVVETAVERVGAERVVFGTDVPFLDPWAQYARITGAAISEEQSKAILGDNAARIFNLHAEARIRTSVGVR